jgi:hypothetical protein
MAAQCIFAKGTRAEEFVYLYPRIANRQLPTLDFLQYARLFLFQEENSLNVPDRNASNEPSCLFC